MKEAAQQAIDYLRRAGPNVTLYLGFATMLDSVIHLTTAQVQPLLDKLDPQKLAARIANPRYVVHDVYDFFEHEKYLCMVLKYIEAPTLWKKIVEDGALSIQSKRTSINSALKIAY